MKKLALLLSLAALFFVVACGGTKADTKPASVDSSVASKLVGTWECENISPLLQRFGFTLPAKLVFKADGTYEWTLTKGKSFTAVGTYKVLDTANKPFKLDVYQESILIGGKSVAKKALGRASFEFTADGKLKIASLTKASGFPRPETLDEDNAQVYHKK